MNKFVNTSLKFTVATAVIVCSAVSAAVCGDMSIAATTETQPKPNSKQASVTQPAFGAGTKGIASAVELLKKAADQGDAVAQFHLAALYEKGDGVTKDLNKAIELYQKAADGGYALAQFYLGFLYQNGDGVLQDLNKAAALYQKAANQGYATAQFFLGSLYENGTGVPKNVEKAVQLYQAASDQGDVAAAQSLKKLQTPTTISAPQQALPSTSKSRPGKDDCEKSYEDAMSYAWGTNGMHLNAPEAVDRLKTLAKTECADAVAILAILGHLGGWEVVPKDEAAAQELANIALADGLVHRADEGRPTAQYGLSVFYTYGLGVTADSDKAWQLANQAADGGSVMAQYYLGLHYYDPSDSTGNDPSKAAYWYEQAAAQGHVDAQFMLGLMYTKGIGVSQDKSKGMQLIQQAANQGDEKASAELAKVGS